MRLVATAQNNGIPLFADLLIIPGLFCIAVGLGFWFSGKARARARLIPTYLGVASYWRFFVYLGGLAVLIGVVTLVV